MEDALVIPLRAPTVRWRLVNAMEIVITYLTATLFRNMIREPGIAAT